MFKTIDVRKSALAILAAALVSLTAGIASSAHASLAGALHVAALAQADETGARASAGRNPHRLTRPANRFQGVAGQPAAPNAMEGR